MKNNKVSSKTSKSKKSNFERAISTLPFKYAKKNAIEIRYTAKETKKKKGASWEEIREIAQATSDKLHKKDENMQIAVRILSDTKWVSGIMTDVGEPVQLYESSSLGLDGKDPRFVQQDEYYAFSFVIIQKGKKEGGDDKTTNNDCLFYAIASILHDDNPFKKPQQLKTFLKLKRKDPVSIDDIPKLETKLKNYKINVSGDHIYISPKECHLTINLKLVDGHFKVDYSKNTKIIKNLSYKELKPILYDSNIEVELNAYDGVRLYNLSSDEFRSIKNSSNEFIIINKQNQYESLEEAYIDFCKDADLLKKESKDFINLYKTGNNVNTALDLFQRFSRHVPYPENMSQKEAVWIDNASHGALIWANNGYEGECYDYDIISHYPALLSSTKLLLPVKEGEFIHITQETFNNYEFIPYGVYRCIVHDPDYRLFRTNPKNYYTHIDLTHARQLGYIIEMIQDNQANVLIYSRDKVINSNLIFGQFIRFMFDLKAKDVSPTVKLIINCLWGALSRKNKISKIATYDDPIDIPSDCQIIKAIKTSKGEIVHYLKNDEIYSYNWARLCPFLLSKGRTVLAKMINPYIDKIVKCHTDGFISTEKLDIQTGHEIGEMKYKGYCPNGKIVNKNTTIATFKI